MTKNPRDHREWTLEELEEDSQGYLAAQAALREDKENAAKQRAYEADLELYRKAFVEAGGNVRDAEAAFKAHRNERAASSAARAAEEAAASAERRHIAGRL